MRARKCLADEMKCRKNNQRIPKTTYPIRDDALQWLFASGHRLAGQVNSSGPNAAVQHRPTVL